MWEARATYEDGTAVERFFEPSATLSEAEDQYNIEAWLIGYHDGCTWYSVVWVYLDE